ncbi:ADP-ribosylglycohydrolase family protein [Corallococcus sp. bb12-1]|uniref:ADP-ribosylglycohydrolase family protein n=1 Tax=Corallococcus sp. bb12-1 TaxID=2996784 RepID=UPI00227037AF|nr:ADP-ribosylglycohydrolase family protein [Corallococcus sp. bb12-1]MCY1042160.1 ADP-ribosylglycohydrolase family protein [Corallococcus sp. bb12-1]
MPPPPKRRLTGPDPLPGQRARGALMGLAVGNALAIPTAGRPFYAPAFPELAVGPYQDLHGGGPHELKKGQVSEPTQLAVALTLSLRDMKRYDAADALRRYRAWQPNAFAVTDPMKEVLEECDTGLANAVRGAGKRVWLKNFRRVANAGALARVVPLGVLLAKDPFALAQAAMEDTALTHFDPRSQLASAGLCAAIAKAVTGGPNLKVEDLLPAAETGISLAGATLARQEPDFVQEVARASMLLREDLALAAQKDPQLYGPELHMHRPGNNAVRAAFRLAFWELIHVPTPQAALLDVIHRGGDTELHAAVTGALVGAFHGEGALPEEWRQKVLLACQPYNPYQKGTVMWEVYHPRHLLLLAPG